MVCALAAWHDASVRQNATVWQRVAVLPKTRFTLQNHDSGQASWLAYTLLNACPCQPRAQ